ncbi:ZIP family metal transporter [Paenibacillus sp. P46E]|uniref:ZIP family metal transporter n=1 Tax=Paenibacillus sp. P46E TaxID=1349436 RepID=UPI00093CF594|nr:ZIP family metal transporter [Paenibacillus sp. P46E]OKP96765.1 hypothetical protein A3849_19450 [Paenibacillus sp. P46E]
MQIIMLSFLLTMIIILSAVIVTLKSNWTELQYKKIMLLSIGVLLTFTFIELIPETLHVYNGSPVIIVSSVFFLFLFQHKHKKKQDVNSIEMLMIGGSLHWLFDGSMLAISLFMEKQLCSTFIIALLFHKFTESMMFAFILYSFSKSKIKLFKCITILASVNIIGILVTILFVGETGNFQIFIGIAMSLSAGLFLYLSFTSLVKLTDNEGNENNTIFAIIGGLLYYFIHMSIK